MTSPSSQFRLNQYRTRGKSHPNHIYFPDERSLISQNFKREMIFNEIKQRIYEYLATPAQKQRYHTRREQKPSSDISFKTSYKKFIDNSLEYEKGQILSFIKFPLPLPLKHSRKPIFMYAQGSNMPLLANSSPRETKPKPKLDKQMLQQQFVYPVRSSTTSKFFEPQQKLNNSPQFKLNKRSITPQQSSISNQFQSSNLLSGRKNDKVKPVLQTPQMMIIDQDPFANNERLIGYEDVNDQTIGNDLENYVNKTKGLDNNDSNSKVDVSLTKKSRKNRLN